MTANVILKIFNALKAFIYLLVPLVEP
jgi:hypothetical protein